MIPLISEGLIGLVVEAVLVRLFSPKIASPAIEKLPQLKSATDGLKEMRDTHHYQPDITHQASPQMPHRCHGGLSTQSPRGLPASLASPPLTRRLFVLESLFKLLNSLMSYLNDIFVFLLIGSRVSSFRKTGRYKLAEQRCSKVIMILAAR
ncbi:Uncharacterized protein Rs2_38975 [Raphanus sativus]|nr:Uncharacterized protein Rs2_38975 [Raphanus sativus]